MAQIEKKVRVRAQLTGAEFAAKMGLEEGELQITRRVQQPDGSWGQETVVLVLTAGEKYTLIYHEAFEVTP